MEQCKLFREWQAQSHFDFGFVLMSHFILPKDVNFVAKEVDCVFEMYKQVSKSG